MNKLKLFLIVSVLAAFVAACGQATTPTTNTAKNDNKPAANAPSPNTSAATPAVVNDVAKAENLYTVNCMTCHKGTGKGGKTTVDGKEIDPDDITTAKQKAKPDEKIYGYISEGFPEDGMPSFKDKLKPEEINLIVKHVRTLQK